MKPSKLVLLSSSSVASSQQPSASLACTGGGSIQGGAFDRRRQALAAAAPAAATASPTCFAGSRCCPSAHLEPGLQACGRLVAGAKCRVKPQQPKGLFCLCCLGKGHDGHLSPSITMGEADSEGALRSDHPPSHWWLSLF